MCHSLFRRHFRGVAVALAVLTVGAAQSAGTASAEPIATTQAHASQLAVEIESLGSKDSALSQQYDGAVLRAQQLDGAVTVARGELAGATRQEQATEEKLKAQAIRAFVQGSDSASLFDLLQGTGKDLPIRSQYLRVASRQEGDVLDQVRVARDAVAAREKSLQAAQQQARAALVLISQSRQQVLATESQLNSVYGQVKGQLAAEVAQAQAAKVASDAAAARTRLAAAEPSTSATSTAATSKPPQPTPAAPNAPSRMGATRSGSSPTMSFSAPPVPVSGGAGRAVAIAEAQVGKPYVWGAAGPGSFDCSGLTMFAWEAAGVSLPHYTVSQFDSTTHVSMGALQPGDLLFNASMGHVAMYVGGGMMVEAPYTGADVRVVPVRSEMVLASRP